MKQEKIDPFERTTEVTVARVWGMRPKVLVELLLITWSITLSFMATVLSNFDFESDSISNEVVAGGLIYLVARVFSLIGLSFKISTHWIFWPFSIAAAVWLMFLWGTASV